MLFDSLFLHISEYTKKINFLHLALGFLGFKVLAIINSFIIFFLANDFIESKDDFVYLLAPIYLITCFLFGFIFSKIKKESNNLHAYSITFFYTIYFLIGNSELLFTNLIILVFFQLFLYLGIKLSQKTNDIVLA